MWYHVTAHYGNDRKRFWWNRDRDSVLNDVLVPLAEKHIVPVTRNGSASIFNFGAVSYVTIVRTEKRLSRGAKRKTPSELSDQSFLDKNNATKEFVDELQSLASTPGNRSLIQRAISKPKDIIFVIMKFGDADLDSAFDGVIKPLAHEFDLEAVRIDQVQDSGKISDQILEHITEAKYVLADLTGERPNCYYEAGFAQAIGKQLIFSIKSGHSIHFDLAGHRFMQWSTESEYRTQLRARLEALEARASSD
ncbi:MAG: hypothetical protein RLW68_09790 [Devosia marina]|uniref:hypothetical protein n=1 Tax=Devosia marina TaxID=2683198 RepID=UPI0032EF3404